VNMSNGKVKLGMLLPTRGILLGKQPPHTAETVLNLAKQAESAGLDSVWVGDSLTAKPRLEPLAALASIAAVTQRVRLGTAVLLAALRQPVLLAQTMATVDLISQGRLIVAAGVGGAFNEDQQREWQAAGIDPRRRASRFEEIVQIVQELSAGRPATFSGKHFQLDHVEIGPPPVRSGGTPFLIACHWRSQAREAQFLRAARFSDGIISISDTPDEYKQVVEQVVSMAADLGREPSQLEKVFYLTVNMNEDTTQAKAEAEDWLTRYYGSDIWGTRWGPFGGPEQVSQRMSEYVEAGAETLVVRFASFQPQRQLEIFLDRVAPAFM